jgi:hypothetical protein
MTTTSEQPSTSGLEKVGKGVWWLATVAALVGFLWARWESLRAGGATPLDAVLFLGSKRLKEIRE